MESAGLPILLGEILTHKEFVQGKVNTMVEGPLCEKGLAVFNFDNGKNAGLAVVLNILESFKEELLDTSSNQTLTDKE